MLVTISALLKFFYIKSNSYMTGWEETVQEEIEANILDTMRFLDLTEFQNLRTS